MFFRSDVHFGLARPFLNARSAPELYYAPDFSDVMTMPVVKILKIRKFIFSEVTKPNETYSGKMWEKLAIGTSARSNSLIVLKSCKKI